MHGPLYVLTWILLLIIPVIALWRRKWWPLSVYVLGFLFFLYTVRREHGEWDDLADFVTLIVIVIPIYIVGSIVWVALNLVDRQRNKKKKQQ